MMYHTKWIDGLAIQGLAFYVFALTFYLWPQNLQNVIQLDPELIEAEWPIYVSVRCH